MEKCKQKKVSMKEKTQNKIYKKEKRKKNKGVFETVVFYIIERESGESGHSTSHMYNITITIKKGGRRNSIPYFHTKKQNK